MTSITAHGKTFPTIEDAQSHIAALRAQNAKYGESDGRVTEINAIEQAITAHAEQPTLDGDVEPKYEVVKEQYGVPCSHPSCAILHRHLAKEPYADGQSHWEWAARPNGTDVQVRVSRWHEVIRTEWIVLRDGQRVGEAHDTKRGALAEAARKPTV